MAALFAMLDIYDNASVNDEPTGNPGSAFGVDVESSTIVDSTLQGVK